MITTIEKHDIENIMGGSPNHPHPCWCLSPYGEAHDIYLGCYAYGDDCERDCLRLRSNHYPQYYTDRNCNYGDL